MAGSYEKKLSKKSMSCFLFGHKYNCIVLLNCFVVPYYIIRYKSKETEK